MKKTKLQNDLVNIIIVGYGLSKTEKNCFNSIIKNTAHPYIITYYDNQKDKYSLTKLWNTLIKNSITDHICLLNNDTEVCPHWLLRMFYAYKKYEYKAFIGPSTNNCHSPQKNVDTFEKASSYVGQDAIEELSQPISGFCFLFNTNIWYKLDGFDERYDFYGAESDFIERSVRIHKYKSVWAKDAFVKHIGSASINKSGKNQEEARKKALKLYWNDPSRIGLK